MEIFADSEVILLRNGNKCVSRPGSDEDEIMKLLSCPDRVPLIRQRRREIAAALAQVQAAPPPEAPVDESRDSRRVLVFGSQLAQQIRDRLDPLVGDLQLIPWPAWTVAEDAGRPRWISPRLGPERLRVDAALEELVTCALDGAALAVVAVENVPYCVPRFIEARAHRAGVPCLFVTVSDDAILMGPITVQGGPCDHSTSTLNWLGCEISRATLRASAHLSASRSSSSARSEHMMLHDLAAQVIEFIQGRHDRRLLVRAVEYAQRGDGVNTRTIDCGALAPDDPGGVDAPAPSSVAAIRGHVHNIEYARSPPPHSPGWQPREFAVIGQGSAGLMAALGIEAAFPGARVKMVYDHARPVIGVGEGTIPSMLGFLYETLKLDPRFVFERLAPTIKLGIQFEWRSDPEERFPYTFTSDDPLHARSRGLSAMDSSLVGMLMDRRRLPVARATGGELAWLLPEARANYAYHIENHRLVETLAEVAAARGITMIDDEVVGHAGAHGRLERLLCKSGRTIEADFFIDCSGFASYLGGHGQFGQWRSYRKSLFCDRALVGTKPLPASVDIPPYTTSRAMSSGWAWQIPHHRHVSVGYVYSADFISDEQARSEFMSAHPNVTALDRTISFRSGRWERFWSGNVAAIGNSFAFVEPLEATALHMASEQISALVEGLQAGGGVGTQRAVNEKIGEQWDYLCDFLGLHYKANMYAEGKFWRACVETIELDKIHDLATEYQWMAPLSLRPDRDQLQRHVLADEIFGLSGVDVILAGLGHRPKVEIPRVAPANWARLQRSRRLLCEAALGHRSGLEALSEIEMKA